MFVTKALPQRLALLDIIWLYMKKSPLNEYIVCGSCFSFRYSLKKHISYVYEGKKHMNVIFVTAVL